MSDIIDYWKSEASISQPRWVWFGIGCGVIANIGSMFSFIVGLIT
jgi:hypothetical protein